MMINLYNPYNGYLQHHGILGMKWGKLNGPPYPLDAEDHSKSEKKAGYRKSLGRGRNEELYDRKSKAQTKTKSLQPKRKGLTDGKKTAIKVAAVAAIAAAGTYALYKSGAFDELSAIGGDQLKRVAADYGNRPIDSIAGAAAAAPKVPKVPKATISEAGKRIAEQCGFKLKTVGMSKVADAAAVNPNYNVTAWATSDNCGYASMGWCLRRLGLDVQIRDDFEGSPFIPSNITDFFSKGVKFPYCRKGAGLDSSSVENIKKSLTKVIMDKYHPTDGHCGMIGMTGGRNKNSTGHFMAWEMVNGVIEFIDPQSQGTVSPDHYFQYVVSGVFKNTEIAFNDFTEAVAQADALKEIFRSRD